LRWLAAPPVKARPILLPETARDVAEAADNNARPGPDLLLQVVAGTSKLQ
jgi:hypothetical protein